MYLGKNENLARRAVLSVAREFGVFVPVLSWRSACNELGIGRQRFHEVAKSLVRKNVLVVRGSTVAVVV